MRAVATCYIKMLCNNDIYGNSGLRIWSWLWSWLVVTSTLSTLMLVCCVQLTGTIWATDVITDCAYTIFTGITFNLCIVKPLVSTNRMVTLSTEGRCLVGWKCGLLVSLTQAKVGRCEWLSCWIKVGNSLFNCLTTLSNSSLSIYSTPGISVNKYIGTADVSLLWLVWDSVSWMLDAGCRMAFLAVSPSSFTFFFFF